MREAIENARRDLGIAQTDLKGAQSALSLEIDAETIQIALDLAYCARSRIERAQNALIRAQESSNTQEG